MKPTPEPAGLRVLLVIHGYPPRYNAGSELYTQQLAHGLAAAGHGVTVFARAEDPGRPDFELTKESDPQDANISVWIVNHARSAASVISNELESAFAKVLDSVRPEVVHIGHLSHLSLGLPAIAKARGIPVVFTIHDFWLMCPRGQFLHWGLTPSEPWQLCSGQDDAKCATTCFNRYHIGDGGPEDTQYWTNWISRRMSHTRDASRAVDLFIAPSRHVMKRHVEDFGLAADRVKYLDYGFDRERCRGKNRIPNDPFVFAYVGRHHPSKGLPQLLRAFEKTKGNAKLLIWGFSSGEVTKALKEEAARLPHRSNDIQWMGPFIHEQLGTQVLDNCHAIVVPSIWEENSPLVIHEAQEHRTPVITAKIGGMSEYVKDGHNGLLFAHRDEGDLTRALQSAIDDPGRMAKLGAAGYLHAADGRIPSVEDHVTQIAQWYRELLSRPPRPVVT